MAAAWRQVRTATGRRIGTLRQLADGGEALEADVAEHDHVGAGGRAAEQRQHPAGPGRQQVAQAGRPFGGPRDRRSATGPAPGRGGPR